jgi:hypothetical protein
VRRVPEPANLRLGAQRAGPGHPAHHGAARGREAQTARAVGQRRGGQVDVLDDAGARLRQQPGGDGRAHGHGYLRAVDPKMMGVEEETIHVSAGGWSPVWVTDNLGVMSVQFMLPNRDDAVIWRGPKKNGLIKTFLKDVEWGELDFLVVDTPPGTSDEHLSVNGFLKEAGVDGAVLVTTPQEVSLLDVRKEVDFCRKAGIRILGIVENMSASCVPGVSTRVRSLGPVPAARGKLAETQGIPFLGAVPLDPRIGMACDYGESFLDAYPDSPRVQGAEGCCEEGGAGDGAKCGGCAA